MVFGVGIVRSFFTPERTRRILAGRRESVGNVLAALLGVVTPFCSCSAVPLFIGFVTTGVPLGVTFSFLISAPMVNEVALVLLFGLFGWKVAALYLGTGPRHRHRRGLGHRPAAARALGRGLGLPDADGRRGGRARTRLTWTRPRSRPGATRSGHRRQGLALRRRRHRRRRRHPRLRARRTSWPRIMGKGAWWSVPLAVLIGVPMYSNAAGIIPVVQALLGKGAALGTVLAFMMSVIGLSLPEMIILRKVLKLPLIATFAGVVAVGILVVGLPVQPRAVRSSHMNVKVLGTGCAKCKKLYAEAEKAVAAVGRRGRAREGREDRRDHEVRRDDDAGARRRRRGEVLGPHPAGSGDRLLADHRRREERVTVLDQRTTRPRPGTPTERGRTRGSSTS